MVPEMETPRVTEIKVRMDCNGCVQKIKKALHGIAGIYDIHMDLSQQKITITGWADPEKIIKAIKKTRKTAVICSNTEQSEEPTESSPEGGAPAGGVPPPEPTNPPAEPTEPGEAPEEQSQLENRPPEAKPSQEYASRVSLVSQQSNPNYLEEVRVTNHHPPDYGYQYAYGPNVRQGYNGQWNSYHGDQEFRGEPSQSVPRGYNGQCNACYGDQEFRGEPSQNVQQGNNGRCKAYHGDPRCRGGTSQAPQYATHSYNTYRQSTNGMSPSTQPSKANDLEEFHGVCHHPPDYGHQYACGPNFQQGYNSQSNAYYGDLGFRGEPSQPLQPLYVTHSYNTYKSSRESVNGTSPSTQPPNPNDPEEVHGVRHHPPGNGYRHACGPNFRQGYNGPSNTYYGHPGFREEPSQPPRPLHVTHSYNTYKPSPYVTEYAYPQSPPRYLRYSRPDYYSQDYYNGNYSNGNNPPRYMHYSRPDFCSQDFSSEHYGNGNNITSMFSEENPNACTIV